MNISIVIEHVNKDSGFIGSLITSHMFYDDAIFHVLVLLSELNVYKKGSKRRHLTNKQYDLKGNIFMLS